jgi:hypothetical protein
LCENIETALLFFFDQRINDPAGNDIPFTNKTAVCGSQNTLKTTTPKTRQMTPLIARSQTTPSTRACLEPASTSHTSHTNKSV